VEAARTKDLRHRKGCLRQQCHFIPFAMCL